MTIINDNLISMANSLGQRTAARDFVQAPKLTDRKLSTLYSDSWIIRKYVDVRTRDMTRLNREITTEMSPEQMKAFEAANRRLGVFKCREELMAWTSLYGDAMVLAITDADAESMKEPLDDAELVQRFIVLDKTAYTFDKDRETDITSANFNKPRMYKIDVGSGEILVHNSRVHRVEAGKRSIKERNTFAGQYGRSDIQPIYQPLLNYLATATNISDIVDQSKTDVLSIEGFNAAIAAGREADFIAVAQAMRSIRSSTDALMIDATANHDQKEMTFAGLVDILKSQRDDLAGACDMPLTRLFGQSAAGFASGEEDNQNYYETLASLQESRLRPADDFFDKFVLREMRSEFNQLDYTYPSIELSNEVEESTILVSTVGALSTALQDGVITEAQYATELKNKGLVNSITDQDINELENMLSEQAQIAASEAEQASRSLLSESNVNPSENNATNSLGGATA